MEKAFPIVVVEILLALETRIRVNQYAPERLRKALVAALNNSFFKLSEDSWAYKGEIQMWQVKLMPFLLSGHLPSISTFILNVLYREGYQLVGSQAVDQHRSDWIFWFQPASPPK